MSTTTKWTTRVDWLHHSEQVADAALEELMSALEDSQAVINIEPSDGHGHRARLSATLTVEARSLRQASAAALQIVEAAAGTKAQGIEVLTRAAFLRELERPSIPVLVGNADIAEILGISRQRAAQLADIDGFPPPVAHIKAGPLRIRAQVEHWASTWERRTGRPPKTV